MTIQTLDARHERGLAVLFERNNTPEVVREFHPFPLDRRTAGRLCHHDGLDQYFVMVADDGVVGFAMLRGWDEGYEVPSFGVLVDRDHQGRGIAAAATGKAIEFNGATDGLVFEVNPLAGLAQFTVEVEFLPAPSGPEEQRFVHFQEANTENRALVELRTLPGGSAEACAPRWVVTASATAAFS